MKRDWVISYAANGATCECCGERIFPYLPGFMMARTVGLQEEFGHREFELVLEQPLEVVGYILNNFGDAVSRGESFDDGAYVTGIFEDCAVRLRATFNEETGTEILRVIIPDADNRWPEDSDCSYPYNCQLRELDSLRNPLWHDKH